MTTLEQIGFTLAGGSAVLVVSHALFGVAVRFRSTFIAPRATARPLDVIYTRNPTTKSHQDRGDPWLGWIPWTLNLTYDTMLNGIPGTGTRENGLSGLLLRVNLDGIVLLRFHSVCLRVAGLACALYLLFGVPIYLSAQCYNTDDLTGDGCGTNAYNLTNYQRTTLANVPAIVGVRPLKAVIDPHNGILWRLYLVVGMFWVLASYLCLQLHQEWVQILAMRRVYYLEYDIWGERRKELKDTLLFEEIAANKRDKMNKVEKEHGDQQSHVEHEESVTDKHRPSVPAKNHFTFEKRVKSISPREAAANAAANKFEPHLRNREPWIPHPEQRDTVPNVALYSILVGGLPSLPEQAADSFNTEQTIQFSKRESIDWQLSLTTTFFDHCVPNQPGFSSSIAAVTIIPGARDLSLAWRKWYAAAAKLRRLKFVRQQIQQRRHYDIESANDHSPMSEGDLAKYEYETTESKKKLAVDYGYGDPDEDEVFVPKDASEDEVSSYLEDFPKTTPRPEQYWDERDETPRGIYDKPLQNQEYYRQVLGSALGNEHDTHIYDSLEFGPEQAAVYAREFAQSAAPCCPNGCNEFRVRNATIDQLMEMERILAVEVHQANLELREARQRATRADSSLMETNIHDQQQKAKPQATSTPKNHSMVRGSALRAAAAFADDDQDQSGNDEGGRDVAQSQHSIAMISRYDRRGSSNDNVEGATKKNAADKTTILQRLETARANNSYRTNDENSADLGLEAKLFKKSGETLPSRTVAALANSSKMGGHRSLNSTSTGRTDPASRTSSLSNSFPNVPPSANRRAALCVAPVGPDCPPGPPTQQNNPNLEVDTSPTPMSSRKKPRVTPILQGVTLPGNYSLEAQLTQDSGSFHGSGSLTSFQKGGSNKMRPPRRLSDIAEADSRSEMRRRKGREPGHCDEHSASHSMAFSEIKPVYEPEIEPQPNKHSYSETTSAQWTQVETIITEAQARDSDRTGSSMYRTRRAVATGQWEWPTLMWLFRQSKEQGKNIQKFVQKQGKDALENMARESTYAVITFTSRQAAVAARSCLADGRAAGRWNTLRELPIPPLADSAPGDLYTLRNCCRPVTLSITDGQKTCRNYISMAILGALYVFYTIPLTLASQFVDPKDLDKLIPRTGDFEGKKRIQTAFLLSGLVTAGIWSGFFALCPILFQV
jgi:hypothetical protein